MPASITISHLSWSTPDGQPVLSDLDCNFQRERAGIVGRNGVGKTTLLKLIAGALEPTKGRITVAGSVSLLGQAVQVTPDETIADLFGVADGIALLQKAEAGQASIEELAEADWTIEARMKAALAQVGLEAGADTLLARLSGGQRTRAALAGAIFAAPDFLLLDEPTNNLDMDGRRAIRDLLRGWRSGAIVISHDRQLLEEMDAIVELTSLGATRYGGNWSHYRERKAIELAAAEHDLASAERRMADVRRKAQITAERQDRRDAAGSRRGARGDLPRILLGARKQQAENSSGGNARLAERQSAEAGDQVAQAKERVEVVEAIAITLPSTGLSSSRSVLDVEHVTGGYAPGEAVINNLSLSISGPERMALTGPNGCGKSTLLHLITGQLQPWSGSVRVHMPLALLDQRVSILDPSLTVAENFARLHPGSTNNAVRAALARFRFRAAAADQLVSDLSGGQMLRAGLACVLGGPILPGFLILDEPTNHLDLESIAAVEAGLSAYDGALLVVSHDAEFLARIGITRHVLIGDRAMGG
ncbi:ABC-F family ATP-binding cassette domain-containing protein [Sphingobium sp. H39-3-25]|uniref:ABC-F family ATP-binding cassette domain-containing protein n=1 Tax=Sphingobium arseniciresistens TaxID=3030834 RepID=UPI0023B90EC5|nr:ABC-F family ATP-binding cassette domain-containing protein [Sphingobium arseniciresistens]